MSANIDRQNEITDLSAGVAGFLESILKGHADATGGHFKLWPNGLVALELEDFNLKEMSDKLVAALALEVKLPRPVEQIIAAAEQHLQTAKFGLTDIKGKPERRRAGLMNAVVFARSATFALQNLRSVIPEFDEWYKGKQDEMRVDPLMTFFNETRRKIEHEAHIPGSGATLIKSLNVGNIHRDFGPAPPGTVGFFMGDQAGGSGWEVLMPDGTKEKYYVDVPEHIGSSFMTINAPGYEHLPASDAVAVYLSRVDAIVKEARAKFIRSV
jgi:hypothetical protein